MNAITSIWAGRTAYQIIPDRFFRKGGKPEHINGRKLKEWNDRMPDWQPDNDGIYRNLYFYGGNLKGIEAKLMYLKNLGFNMIYITPIGQSRSYHHYDVGNHLVIDPWIGNWQDFRSLCTKARELGILIVVDLVFNHTGIDSIYYKNPQYQNWYKKTESGEQVFWYGFTDMPECNTLLKEYQEAMTRVVEKYLENGASGIRFDLGENLPKPFLMAVARVKEKYPNAIFIGEMWKPAGDKEDSKIFDGQFDSIMNYPMADAILRWVRYGYDRHFEYNFKRVYGEYPKSVQNVLLNNLGTHDTPTTLTMLAGDMMNTDVFNKFIWDIEGPWLQEGIFNTYKFREYEAKHDQLTEEAYTQGKKLLKIALTIMYNIPGIPCVYQGTEVADSGYKDPFNRKPYPWDKDEKEIRNFVKALGEYRKQNIDILATGDVKVLKITDSILIMERSSTAGKIITCLNRSEHSQEVNLSAYLTEPKEIFKTNNSTAKSVNPFGIIIVRGN